MKKTICIPKGEKGHYSHLTCENVVVDGFLEIENGIFAKRISGTGVMRANTVKVDSLVIGDITAGYIVADKLVAKRVSAVSVVAVRSMLVSSHLEAGYVKTPKAILAAADVEDMQADEIERLRTKRHGLFSALLISTVKSFCADIFYKLKRFADDFRRAAKSHTEQSGQPDMSEPVRQNVYHGDEVEKRTHQFTVSGNDGFKEAQNEHRRVA